MPNLLAAKTINGRSLVLVVAASRVITSLALGTRATFGLRRAAHSKSYLMLNLAFLACGFHVTFIGTHLISYATDIGAGASAGRIGLMMTGLFNIVGSLGAGYLGTLFGIVFLSHQMGAFVGAAAIVVTGCALATSDPVHASTDEPSCDRASTAYICVLPGG